MNVWKFTVHILLKPRLENFEHYFTMDVICTRPSSKHFIHLFDPHKSLIKHWSIQRRWENLGKWKAARAELCSCLAPGVCAPCQGAANFVKDQEVYRFYGLYSLWGNYSVLLLYHAGIQYTNKWLWLCSSTTVLMDTKVCVPYQLHSSHTLVK